MYADLPVKVFLFLCGPLAKVPKDGYAVSIFNCFNDCLIHGSLQSANRGYGKCVLEPINISTKLSILHSLNIYMRGKWEWQWCNRRGSCQERGHWFTHREEDKLRLFPDDVPIFLRIFRDIFFVSAKPNKFLTRSGHFAALCQEKSILSQTMILS